MKPISFEIAKAIQEAKAYISACVRYKNECQEQINKNNTLIAKCETKQSVESLIEYNRYFEESIAEEKAEIEKWQGIIHDIEFVINILERNEDYELYYSNC